MSTRDAVQTVVTLFSANYCAIMRILFLRRCCLSMIIVGSVWHGLTMLKTWISGRCLKF